MGKELRMRRCVDPFTEGRSAWTHGKIGFFTRRRGLIITVVLMLLTMGAPWWLPAQFAIPATVTASTRVTIVIAAFLVGVALTGGFVYLRKRTIRSLDIKALLHDFSHYLRDYQTKVFKRTAQQKGLFDKDKVELERFSEYMGRVCEYTRDYFALMTHDSTINCAIRLAVETDDPDSKGTRIVYRTLGRSSGLSPARAETSEDIPSNQGIPRFFVDDHDCKGVLRYNDLEEAAKLGVFKMTESERRFPDEIETILVAPMNGWDGKRRSMVGLLYVTSRNGKVFQRKHVDCMRFVADMVAASVCFTLQRVKDSGLATEIKRSKS